MGAETLLGRRQEIEARSPFVQRDMAALKDGPDANRKLLLAAQADIETGATFGFGRAGALRFATMWAETPIGPAQAFQIRAGLVFVVKYGV